MCFFISGAYYSFDNPAELENVLEKKFQISMTEYSLLYSLYSLPNTIIPFLGGIFIDSAGYYAGLIISSVIVTIGQTIIAVGHGWRRRVPGLIPFNAGWQVYIWDWIRNSLGGVGPLCFKLVL